MTPNPLDRLRESLRAALPKGWNVRRDVLLAVGSHATQVVRAYRLVGQERAVVVVPDGGGPPADVPAGVLVAEVGRLAPALQGFAGAHPENVQLVPDDGSGGSPAFLEAVRRAATNGLRARVANLELLERHGREWLLRTIDSLPAVASSPDVGALDGAFAGRPALVASPGPSLSKQLEHLAAVDGRAVVLAGSHAVGALVRAGVPVDVALALDPGEVLLEHFADVDVARLGALVTSTNVVPELLALPFPRRFFCAANGPLDTWAFPDRRAALAGGGSVSCTAFSLAVRMGCDPVVLVGQDLSWCDGRFYAAETLDGTAEVLEEDGAFRLRKPVGAPGPGHPMPDGTKQLARPRAVTTLPGWHGGEVPTSTSFAQFHAWFECEARVHGATRRLVNATEGGARIEGFEQRPLAEVLDEWGEAFDTRGVLQTAADVGVETRSARVRRHVADAARPDGALGRLAAAHGLLEPSELERLAASWPR